MSLQRVLNCLWCQAQRRVLPFGNEFLSLIVGKREAWTPLSYIKLGLDVNKYQYGIQNLEEYVLEYFKV